MQLFSEILPNTARSMIVFGALAVVIALVGHSAQNTIVTRVVIEIPLLLLLGSLVALIANILAASFGALLGGKVLASALMSLAIGWAVSGGGNSSFAGLGYHALLQPAFAISLGAPWLLKAFSRRT